MTQRNSQWVKYAENNFAQQLCVSRTKNLARRLLSKLKNLCTNNLAHGPPKRI